MRPEADRGTFLHGPESYGKSRLGQPLEVWHASEEPEVLIVGGMHGEEPDTTVLLSRTLRLLEAQPARAAIVPAANPDGILRGTRGNANGVDLNRNFPTEDWKPHPVTHRWTLEHESEVRLGTGDTPASEPETRALIELVSRLQPRRIISFHGHLACIEDPGSSALGRWVSERTDLPLVESVGYATPGSMGTWAAENGFPIITWELPPEPMETMFHTQLPVLFEVAMNRYPS